MVQYQEPYPASTRGDRYGTLSAYRRAHNMAPHRGMDWAPGDVPALAVADGTVVLKRWSSILGNVLVLKHADGLYSGYCHLDTMPKTLIGARVARHASIGAHVGETGTAATGRHLHLTLSTSVEGVFYAPAKEMRDPLAWILAHDAAPAAAPTRPAPAKGTVVVKEDDTLSKIATRVGTTWQKLAAKNGLKPPYTIHPDQRLTLP